MSETPTAPGLVYTFYSYKGGVGRSMALVNVGVILAADGKRVLLVDWDLEAPGLEVYFEHTKTLVGDPASTGGVVDILEAHVDDLPLTWRDCLLKAEVFGHSLDLISAGRRTDGYRRRVQQLDWDALFREHRIGNFISSLREEWRGAYDIVLIDSRTGINDIGDICTVLLPDVLVLLFVTNHQNVEGTTNVMERAVRARAKLPINRSKLMGVPVPARDERDREYERSLQWQDVFVSAFGDLYREWLPKDVRPIDALNKIFIPYVASWSFGESIPVIQSERERSDPTSLGAAYSRLATLLSHRLDWSAIDAGATGAELAGVRIELSRAREEARETEAKVLEAVRDRALEIVFNVLLVMLVLLPIVGSLISFARQSGPAGDVNLEAPDEVGEESPSRDSGTENLLDRLLYKGVLPRYAFPTDVATFHVFDPERDLPYPGSSTGRWSAESNPRVSY